MNEWDMNTYFSLKGSGIEPGPGRLDFSGEDGRWKRVEENLLAEAVSLPGLG